VNPNSAFSTQHSALFCELGVLRRVEQSHRPAADLDGNDPGFVRVAVTVSGFSPVRWLTSVTSPLTGA
jgi:hypothetical protein